MESLFEQIIHFLDNTIRSVQKNMHYNRFAFCIYKMVLMNIEKVNLYCSRIEVLALDIDEC